MSKGVKTPLILFILALFIIITIIEKYISIIIDSIILL